MALLTTQQRQELAAEFMRLISAKRTTCDGSKADIVAVIAAADQFQEDNADDFNAAIPAGPRGRVGTALKSFLFSLVANKRYGG